MTNTSAPNPHYIIENLDSSVRIKVLIPRPKSNIAFQSVPLVFWFFFELLVCIPWLFKLFSSLPSSISLLNLFKLAFIIANTFIGIYLWYIFFAIAVGKETIEVSNQAIIRQIQIFFFNRSYSYFGRMVNHLRASPIVYDPLLQLKPRPNAVWDYQHGPIVFEFGSKTIHMGSFLEEADAKEIVAAIGTRFPQYLKSA